MTPRKKLSTSASNRTANGSCTRLNSTLGAGGEQSSGVTSLMRCTVWRTKRSRLLERKQRRFWRWTGIYIGELDDTKVAFAVRQGLREDRKRWKRQSRRR